MTKLKLLASAIFAALATLSATAATDIYSAAWKIAAANKGVASAKAAGEAALSSARAENTVAGPEAEFEYKFADSGNDDNRWGLSVGQSFDWPGAYSARREAINKRAAALELQYDAALADAAYEAMLALIDYAAAEEQLKIIEKAVANTETKNEAIEYAYSRGEVTAIDYRKMKLELFVLRTKAARARTECEAGKAAIAALNGGVLPEELPSLPENEVVEDFSVYRAAFNSFNPAVAARRSMTEALAAEAKAVSRSAMPSLKISYVHDFEENMHFNGFGIGIGLPSWSNRSRSKAAKAEVEAARLDAEDFSTTSNAELEATYAAAVELNRRLDRDRATFTGDDYTALLDRALDIRKITVIEYFNEYTTFLDAVVDYVSLKADLARAMAYLNRYTAPAK